MFWRKKLRSLWRPREHQVSVLPASDGAASAAREDRTKSQTGDRDKKIRRATVREGWMLLDALLKRGVEYPHLCKLGDCRRCKSVLVRGSIDQSAHYEGALSPDEEARGVFLACRATPTSDCSIRIYKDAK